jgi:hypothetical protein
MVVFMNITARAFAPALLGLFSLLAACEDSTSSPAPGAPGSDVPQTGDESPPVSNEPSCPTTTTGPTMHEYDVGENEVWTAEASPHVIEYDVSVRSGRTLTIEPCAKVLVKKGQHLMVAFPGTPNSGKLIAEGTAKRPISFAGFEGQRWASLFVYAPGTARLAHVSLEGGGGGDFEQAASLVVRGDGEDGADPLVFADNVTIEGSLGLGATFERGATFIEGSKDLRIEGSGEYPISVSEHALDRLPTGTYTGNAKDEILIDPEGGKTAGTGFLDDATIHDRGVPYMVGRSQSESLRIGGRTDERLVTLTIEAGVKLKFGPGGALKVQHFTTDKPSTGALRALGTAAKPIVLTSAAAAPAPGDWMGLWFGGIPRDTNVIDHVKIEYAGGDCGCILNTCSAITEHEGAIIFTAQPPSAFVKNTEFAFIANHAITEGYDGAFVNFRDTNTFTSVAGCEQTRPRESTTTCPLPKPACD